MKRSYSLATLEDLRGLKESLQMRHATFRPVAPPCGRKKSESPKSDDEIFREAMADVREIKEFREIPFRKAPEIRPRACREDDTLSALREIVSGKRKIRLSDTGEYIEWTFHGSRRDIAGRLHRGDFSVQDFIDLHGMTLGEAEEALRCFFRESARRRLFCVKIIHGRGLRSPQGPVLKEALKGWLHGTLRKWTAAYATARDCDGGLGAVYIILKSG